MKPPGVHPWGGVLAAASLWTGVVTAEPGAPPDEPAPVPAPPVEVTVRGPAVHPLLHVRDREVFEAGVHRSGSDLMATVPGVFVTQHSGDGKAHQIFFRGFDAAHGQDLELEVGGVPVNEVSHIHGQGYADVHFIPPEVVQRIVALPFAFDASQGDFAVAGSLRYELGLSHPGVIARAGVGSFGSRRALLAFRPAGAPAQTFVAAEVGRSEGFGPARQSERMSGLLQWRGSLGEGVQARLLASTYAARFASPGVVRARDVELGIVERQSSYDERQGGESWRSALAFELGHSNEDWSFEGTPFLVFRSLRLQSNYTGALLHPLTSDNTLQRNDATTLGVRSRLGRRLGVWSSADELRVGVVARHDRIAQGQRYLDAETTVDAGVNATQLGAYLELRAFPWERLLVQAALRADRLSFEVEDRQAGARRESSGVHLSPRTMIEVPLFSGFSTFAGYGAGFRSPQARSLVDGERTPFSHVESVEAGVRHRDGERLSAQLSAFASFLEDDLSFNEATSRNEAVPATRRQGLAADLVARVGGFVSACGGSYTQAIFTASDERHAAGASVPFVPRWVARCDLGVRGSLGAVLGRDLRFRVGSSFSSLVDRPLPFGERGSDVFLVDGLAAVRLGDVEFELAAENLLAREWNDGEFVYASAFPGVPPSAIPLRHFTAGSPRSVFATLTLELGAGERH